jgi:hypothetical protein
MPVANPASTSGSYTTSGGRSASTGRILTAAVDEQGILSISSRTSHNTDTYYAFGGRVVCVQVQQFQGHLVILTTSDTINVGLQ